MTFEPVVLFFVLGVAAGLLRSDPKKAVEELTRNGIATYCLSLDPRADPYVSRIFGAKNYRVLDHVQHLPTILPLLYIGLTR